MGVHFSTHGPLYSLNQGLGKGTYTAIKILFYVKTYRTLPMSDSIFKFRKNDQIGAAGAEEDHDFLSSCFVDTGDIDLLQDTADRRQIILGRTGTGKSALLIRLRELYGPNVITINPEELALTYVSNSTILNFFAELNVNLDPFFKLLWRHVLTVEVLNHHFEIAGRNDRRSLLDVIGSMFSGTSKRDREMNDAVNYLKEWGASFWKETEYRVKEITDKFEESLNGELKAQLGTDIGSLGGSANAAKTLSKEQKIELHKRGQAVVSKAQVKDLSKVISLLDTILGDRQKKYFILIDKLDENWVEEKLRYKLIMALILTAKDFLKVNNAKIVIALRRDLIERVFRLTRDSGFQEEKYQSLYLPLKWTNDDLIELLDRRIDMMVKRRYTKKRVTHKDLLPDRIHNMAISDYIVQIAPRPRDVISFFNICINQATNLSRLKANNLLNAEGEYSRSRLRALADEWSSDYQTLLEFAPVFQNKPPSFKLDTIDKQKLEKICLDLAVKGKSQNDFLQQKAHELINGNISIDSFTEELFYVFYKIGLVGLKPFTMESESWVDEIGKGVSRAEVGQDVSVLVHPTYRRALGITLDKRKK